MAEFYKWLNVDKKEYLSPWNFDLGNRRMESMGRGNGVLCALKQLLDGRWRGDRIVFLGDECTLSAQEENPVLKELHRQTTSLGYPRTIPDLVSGEYRNISCLFQEAEKVTRADIRLMQEEIESESIFELPNEYGVDWKDPFSGLFINSGKDFNYTVNRTKGVCYCLGKTQILCPGHGWAADVDPLPVLMGYGLESKRGPWLGDVVDVSDELPDGAELLNELVLNL